MKDYTVVKGYPLVKEQNEAVEFLLNRATAINGLQTGLGKTLSTLTAAYWLLYKYKDLHLIVACPQKALKAFKKELSRSRVQFNVLESSKKDFTLNKRITVVTHTSMQKYEQDIVDLRARYRLMCIFDEAHCLQDPEGKLYKLVARMRPLFAVFWAATATPLKNDISGLYFMINIVRPNYLGSWEAFKYSYLKTKRTKIYQKVWRGGRPIGIERTVEEILGYKNLDVLKSKLDDIIIIRQKKYNLEFHYLKTNLTNEEETFYLNAGAGLFMKKETKDVWAARLHQLQRIVDNIHENYNTDEMKLSSKEKCLMKLLKDKLQSNEPCIVYFDYKEALDRIKFILEKTKAYTGIHRILEVSGDIKIKQREEVEELIDSKSIVLVTQAGTESINLQKANNVVFYDIPFAIQSFIQMVGRVTRMDTKYDHQNIYFIEATGTSDTYRRMLIQLHADLIRALFGEINTLPFELTTIDKGTEKRLKNALLWAFKQKRLATEEEIARLFKNIESLE